MSIVFISTFIYTTFIIYILLGLYGLSVNKSEALNRIFAILCLCLAVWSFTLTFAISANSYESALIWRRLTTLGWGIVYSVILHYVLILTGMKDVLKRKIFYLVIYLPAVINVLVFGLITRIAIQQYNLIYTKSGWVNIPVNNFLDWYFYVYYIVWSLIAFYLLIRAYLKNDDHFIKNNSLLLFVSYASALAIGTFTDIVANKYLPMVLPTMATVVILIPIITIIISIRKYRFFGLVNVQSTFSEGTILTSNNRKNLFRIVPLFLYTASILNVYLNLSQAEEMLVGVFINLALVIAGIIIYLIPIYIQSHKNQNTLFMTVVLVTLVLVTLFNYENYMSNLIWPIPLFYIMLTIIFNNRRFFVVTAVTSLVMGIVTWIRLPEFTVRVDTFTNVFHLVFLVVAISLTVYIQKIFVSRIKDNERQVRIQELITSISTDFASISISNFDEKMTAMLEKSSVFTGSDRCYLGLYDTNKVTIKFSHEWLGEGIPSVKAPYAQLKVKVFPWSYNQLSRNKIVVIPSIDALPLEAKDEKEIMIGQGIKSLVMMPIISGEDLIGLIGLDQLQAQKDWHSQNMDILRLLANIVAEAFGKIEIEKNLYKLAYYDTLTGLPNRLLFSNRVDAMIEEKSDGEEVALLLLDIDNFKDINDSFGQEWGDDLLIEVGRRLESCLKSSDIVARFGGDEFLIILSGMAHKDEIEDRILAMMDEVSEPIMIHQHEHFIAVSIGVALYSRDGVCAADLIKHADLAMNDAKNTGKNCYRFCSDEMKDNVFKTMEITNALYRALENDEIQLYYQPQVCIESGEIIGMEALIRWDHPELGRISPGIFIPLAEQTGLINDIGEWVIRRACLQNKYWQDQGFKPIQVSVNLSIEQFRSRDIYEIIKENLEESQLAPEYFEIEITEGVTMNASNSIVEALQRIKTLGIAIAIDDFGTEYSSFSRLKELPIDRLKIDIQFIRGIGVNYKDESLIKVMIHLAQSLGIKVIAEGVETKPQFNFLAQEACDEIQGYYCFKPMSVSEIEMKVMTQE